MAPSCEDQLWALGVGSGCRDQPWSPGTPSGLGTWYAQQARERLGDRGGDQAGGQSAGSSPGALPMAPAVGTLPGLGRSTGDPAGTSWGVPSGGPPQGLPGWGGWGRGRGGTNTILLPPLLLLRQGSRRGDDGQAVTGVLGCSGCRLPRPPLSPFSSSSHFSFPPKASSCHLRAPPRPPPRRPAIPSSPCHGSPSGGKCHPPPRGAAARGASQPPHVVPPGRAAGLPLPRLTPPWGQPDAALGMAYATTPGSGWHRPEDSTAPCQGWGDMPLGTGCHPRARQRCQQQQGCARWG